MQAIHLRRSFVLPVAATMLLLGDWAFADSNDPASIEQRLKALETTPERQAMVREPVSQARKALKRLADARAAGDAPHAVQLTALANDWATLAANVVKAAELEKEVAAQQAKLTELDQKRRRTETLLEATIAQRERTRQELSRSSTSSTATSATNAKAGEAKAKTKTGPTSGLPASAEERSGAASGSTQPASAAPATPAPAAPQQGKSVPTKTPAAQKKGKP